MQHFCSKTVDFQLGKGQIDTLIAKLAAKAGLIEDASRGIESREHFFACF
jgi:hypothetical protein